MPTDIVELKWRCCHCPEYVNLGRASVCVGCGHPRCDKCLEIDVADPGAGNGVKDVDLLKTFKGGADWVCKFCDSHERKSTGDCANCGGPETQGKSREDVRFGRSGTVARSPTPDPWPPPVVDRSRGQRYEEPIDADVRRFMPNPVFWNTIRIGIAFGAAFLLALLLYFVFRTRELEAKVEAVNWVHTVIVDRYSIHHHGGFAEHQPSGAFNIQEEGTRLHHYDHVLDHYDHVSRTRQVPDGQSCRTPSCYTTSRSCSNNKNGSKTCTGGDRVCPSPVCSPKYRTQHYTEDVAVYRDEPVYRMHYAWDVWEWAYNRSVRASGTSTKTHWPSDEEVGLVLRSPSGEQERARQEASYKVIFVGDRERFEYDPKTLDAFQRFDVGTRRRIKVGMAHGVEVLP